MKKLIDGLSRPKLEKLYTEWSLTGENPELLKYVGERLEKIRAINGDFNNYSSDRTIEHSDADLQGWISFMKKFNVSDFSFLAETTYRNNNRIGVFMRNGQLFFPYGMTLSELTDFYGSGQNIYDYESTYNTLNYIRDRFYRVGSGVIFQDFEEKKQICELKLGAIARYILDIKNGTKLKLSIGDRGLVRSANGTYLSLRPYQEMMIEAFAFGTDLEKLENDNFEDCKRLLYLPRSVKRNK